MARLPWQHVRSRTRSSSEKPQSSEGQGWFTRNTAEPSRQALVDLVKVHRRESSGDSSSLRSRSRGTTITSMDWQNGRSRQASVTDENTPPQDSPSRRREGSVYSMADSSSSKSILSKGGLMLRRTGTKLSLSSTGSSSNTVVTSPPRTTTSVTTSSGRDETRSKISAPFDFQHVTHTEQEHFHGLSRIEETELVHRFSHIATDQLHASELRGIQASAITATNPSSETSMKPQCLTAVNLVPETANIIPSRPAPPPKDTITLAGPGPREALVGSLPRSAKIASSSLLSRLPPLPIVDTSIKPEDVIPFLPSGTTQSSTSVSGDKPLPRLPVIHAVTTEDDTARAMISAPLPTPPATSALGSDTSFFARTVHQRQKSSVALPRHMSFYPSSKASLPNLQAVSYLDATKKVLPRHRSDMALSRQRQNSPPSCHSRTSTNFGPIDTCNWEDAVDEAWDDVDDGQDSTYGSIMSQHIRQHEQTAPQGIAVEHSAGSTPLTMADPPRLHLDSFNSSFDSAVGISLSDIPESEALREDERQVSLAGLGIMSFSDTASQPSPINFSRSSSLRLPRHSLNHHSPNESLTRSSSQESIILSIASSINGTQRSSSSSVLAEDLLSMSRIQEDTVREAIEEDQNEFAASEVAQIRVRPESGCLPSGIMKQIARESVEAKVLLDRPVPLELPSTPVHKHSKSTPKVSVPERRSSMVATNSARPMRFRSNTTGGRPRPSSRISYSLFPTPSPTTVATQIST